MINKAKKKKQKKRWPTQVNQQFLSSKTLEKERKLSTLK